jgi:hypothetical protein
VWHVYIYIYIYIYQQTATTQPRDLVASVSSFVDELTGIME